MTKIGSQTCLKFSRWLREETETAWAASLCTSSVEAVAWRRDFRQLPVARLWGASKSAAPFWEPLKQGSCYIGNYFGTPFLWKPPCIAWLDLPPLDRLACVSDRTKLQIRAHVGRASWHVAVLQRTMPHSGSCHPLCTSAQSSPEQTKYPTASVDCRHRRR